MLETACKIAEVTLACISIVAFAVWFRWAGSEISRLRKKLNRLEKRFNKACETWSINEEATSEEMLKLVADREAEKAEYEAKIKNLKHANKQLAKGEKSNG